MDNLQKQLARLENDEAFQNALSSANSPAEAVKVLAEYGVKISEQELLSLSAGAPAEGELTEDSLENVSGGCLIGWIVRYIAASRYSAGGGGFSSGGGGGGSFGGGGGGGGGR